MNTKPRSVISSSSALAMIVTVRTLVLGVALAFLGGCASTVPSAPEGNRLIDRSAPGFTVETLDGKTFRLEDHVGKRLIVLNVFGTWCPPCRAELPALNRIHAENPESVLLFGIALNVEASNVRQFMDNLNLDFPVTMTSKDLEDGITDLYDVPTVPTTIVIGHEGRVIYYKPGMLRKHHFGHLRNLVKEFEKTRDL